MTDGADDIRERVASAISEAMQSVDEMVNKWVACVETIDSDGRRALWALTDPDAKPWDTLGMLTFAVQREQAASLCDATDEDDD